MAYAGALVIKKPASFKLNDVEYKDQVWSVTLTPETPVQTITTYGGVDVDRGDTVWTMDLAGHSRRITGSLGVALDTLSAAGDPVECVIQYATAVGSEIVTFDIMPVPVAFGGEAGSWLQFEQSFSVQDAPVFTAVEA